MKLVLNLIPTVIAFIISGFFLVFVAAPLIKTDNIELQFIGALIAIMVFLWWGLAMNVIYRSGKR